MTSAPPTVAYLVSRFPHVSETFIVREINALEAEGRLRVELGSLFPPVDATVHDAARSWIDRLSRPSAVEAARDLGWWALRRPLRLATTVAAVVATHRHSPRILVRAVATVPLAAAHARRLRSQAVEHVHAHYATYPALAAWICRRLAGLGYSFTAHAHDLYVDQSMLDRKVADAAFVVTVSEFNRRLLVERGADPARVELVHCGIDPRAYAYRPRRPPASGPVRALCVASLQEYKGHAVLLEALASAPELARVELDLVGGGGLQGALERRVRELGLADRVRFHGSVPEEEVRDFMARADLLVLPSIVARDGQMEGLPVVLMEALACGLCPVATRLSGIPEIVEDGITGLLAEPGDPVSLRRALERAVAGADFDAGAGRALVEAEFDVHRSARRLGELLTAGADAP